MTQPKKRLVAVLALSLAFLCAPACVSRTVVHRISGGNDAAPRDGVTYALPKTVVGVRVPVEETQSKLGVYADTVPCFFPEKSEVECGTRLTFDLSYTTGKCQRQQTEIHCEPGEKVTLEVQSSTVIEPPKTAHDAAWEIAPANYRAKAHLDTGTPGRAVVTLPMVQPMETKILLVRASVDSGRVAATQTIRVCDSASSGKCPQSAALPSFSSKRYKLGAASFYTKGVDDPDNVFMIDLKGGRFEDKMLAMTLSEEGVPDKIEAATTNYTGDIVTQAVSSAAALVGAFVSPTSVVEGAHAIPENTPTRETLANKLAEKKFPKCEDKQNWDEEIKNRKNDRKNYSLQDYWDALYFRFSACSLNAQGRAYWDADDDTKLVKRDWFFRYAGQRSGEAIQDRASKFIRAYEMFKKLEALQNQRATILTQIAVGSLPAEALKLTLAENGKMIEEISAYFFSTSSKKTHWLAAFEYTPQNCQSSCGATLSLFAFDERQGICDSPWNSAVRLASAEPEKRVKTCVDPAKVVMTLNHFNAKNHAAAVRDHLANVKPPKKNADLRGIYYRIPAAGEASLCVDSRAGDSYVTLTGDISASVTTIGVSPLANAAFFQDKDFAEIDNGTDREYILILSGGGTQTWTVTRAQHGTAGKAFSSGAAVRRAAFNVPHSSVGRTVAAADIRVAQFGVVAAMPYTTGGRKTQYAIDFFSATGAIKNVKVDTERALRESQVKAVGESAVGIVTAERARRAAQPQPQTQEEKERAARMTERTDKEVQLCIEILNAILAGERPATDYPDYCGGGS